MRGRAARYAARTRLADEGSTDGDRHPLFGKTGGALVVMAIALGGAEVAERAFAPRAGPGAGSRR